MLVTSVHRVTNRLQLVMSMLELEDLPGALEAARKTIGDMNKLIEMIDGQSANSADQAASRAV